MSLVTHQADFLERHEKMMIFNAINKEKLRSNVLFCFRCEEWLTAPIFTEELGVHVCGRCHRVENDDENDETTAENRNKTLEDILAMFYFPCKHYKKGCGVVSKYKDILQHQVTCNAVTNAWKELHCSLCEYKTSKQQDLIAHFIQEHQIQQVEATGQAYTFTGPQFGLIIVKMQSNLFVFKRTEKPPQSNIQICVPGGKMPQFGVQLYCTYCGTYKSTQIDTNLNQLKDQGTKEAICQQHAMKFEFKAPFCKNLGLGCLSAPHAEGIDCSYACVSCCEESFLAHEHYEHILTKHSPRTGALVERRTIDETNAVFINIDNNILRLINNSLAKLYWFGGNWKYTVIVLHEGVECAQFPLELCEIHALPEQWDIFYVFRYVFYDEK